MTLKFWKQLNVVLHAKAIRQQRKTDLLNISVYTDTQQQQQQKLPGNMYDNYSSDFYI